MAYYSSSGQMIRSGAAGLGEFFDASPKKVAPPVHAFQDGVFGGGSADMWTTDVGNNPGPLMAYQDGSLGACAGCGEYEQAAAGLGYPLFIDGKPVDRPVSIVHAPTAMGQGPLMAYKDGSLGEYFSGEAPSARAYRDGSLGEYFSGEAPRAGAFRSGILGAIALPGGASAKVVDLTNPQALKETKMAIAVFMSDVAFVDASVNPAANVGAGYYDAAFYDSPIWGPKAEELWGLAVERLAAQKLQPEEVSQSSKGHSFPTPMGLSSVLAFGAGAPVGDPSAFANNYPVLSAFQAAAVAAAGDLKDFKVLAPFFTTAEKVKGKSMFAGMSTGVVVGIGALAAVGAFLVLRKK